MVAEGFCPYVGLVPYTEDDAHYFFGRERETRLVISNLFASRLTLLYGASGVGKSSVLRAGVLHELDRRATAAVTRGERPEQVAVYLKSWQGDVVEHFHDVLVKALSRAFPGTVDFVPRDVELAEALGAVSEKLEVDLLVILDQFEEYFLYHGDDELDDEPFARQLTEAVNRPGLPVSFLVVLRDDALARLDCFKARIPRLFSNYLRLRPLDREAARRAIVEPLAVYNRRPSSERIGGHVRVEPELVEAVLDEVRRGRLQLAEGGRGGVEIGDTGIEAAFLQLVMTRVWEAEVGAGSRALRARTLAELGGAAIIVRGHLDRVMRELSADEHSVCASIFQHLVTPSGAKVAHTAVDLAGLADVEPGSMERLLSRISGSGMRLLTPVAPSDAVAEVRYEIYHDALAQAMIEWRRRYVDERQRAELEVEAARQKEELEKERRTARRLRRLSMALMAVVVLALAAMVFAWFQMGRAQEEEQRAEANSRLAEEQGERVESVARRATDLAERLRAANEAKAEEERKRTEAERDAAERAGDSERAKELSEELERSEQASREQKRVLEELRSTIGAEQGVGEEELAAAVDIQMAALRGESEREAKRADDAEEELKSVREDLEAARATITDLRSQLENPQNVSAGAMPFAEGVPLDEGLSRDEERGYEVAQLGMRFVWVPSGRFQMGSPDDEAGREGQEVLHEVEISRAFWMAETEVTQGQWRHLMGNNPSRFSKCGDECPVESVNWYDALEFANRLSDLEGLPRCYRLLTCKGIPGWQYVCQFATLKGVECPGYRLPSEAEWEYAARAGTTGPFWTGDNLTTEQANYDGRSPYGGHPKGEYRHRTVAVRSFGSNPWGLYEIHGNVWEWSHDWLGTYRQAEVQDPLGPKQGSLRVLRGGSWNADARSCRSAARGNGAPDARSSYVGFRLVRTVPPES